MGYFVDKKVRVIGINRAIYFENAKLIQLRANHNRVPREIIGWGLSKECIHIRDQFWIFGPSCGSYDFYWMHTNLILEIEVGTDFIQFETDSRSVYRVDYFGGDKPVWVKPGHENVMRLYVHESRRGIENS
jgi:hypothetical protein